MSEQVDVELAIGYSWRSRVKGKLADVDIAGQSILPLSAPACAVFRIDERHRLMKTDHDAIGLLLILLSPLQAVQ